MKWAATFWEDSNCVDPAFSGLVVSGLRFDSPEAAEKYGKEAFGECYAGVRQVESASDERPF